MLHQITEKIPNGKLLTVKVEFDHKIKHVQILGDFFAHPEESIIDIESRFMNVELGFDGEDMIKDIEGLISRRGYELIGVDAASIVRLVKRALG
ncbi:MAG: hypothetical protein NDI94_04655 [Candidatus Woesearchaeota archaeon]|nr:hypothetical protein [Candidatus Woesearchaeota archaeon]